MTHVFIVNEQTFKQHLEYLFAGTGAKDVSTEFIFNSNTIVGTQDEKRSVGMICDISRIRTGDKIIFFVTGIAKFYGVFEAASECFIDKNDNDNYLYNNLDKKLTYRILIKPYKVFKYGISEYDYLDKLDGLNYPDEICWSLIYRKLGGNRGCTMITDAEYKLFEKRLTISNELLQASNFSFDETNKTIATKSNANNYLGRKFDAIKNLRNNFELKYRNKKAFEHYLQLFTIFKLKSNQYTKILNTTTPITWIGNEVMCSVGEHRIDILTLQENESNVDISIIELKDEKLYSNIKNQLVSYVVWLKDYIVPYYIRQNKLVTIHPIIISDGIPFARESTKNKLIEIETDIRDFDWNIYQSTNVKIKSTKIIHFNDEKGNIII